MTKKLRLATILAALGILLVGAFTVHAAPAARSTSDVFTFPPPGTMVSGASSTLVRTDDGVTMTFRASELEPGIYTIWWAIFHDGSPTPTSVLWATGHIVGDAGVGNFAAYLREDNPPGEVFAGSEDGLEDARQDVVRLILRFHGEPIPGRIKEQRTLFAGGCDVNPCAILQFSDHSP